MDQSTIGEQKGISLNLWQADVRAFSRDNIEQNTDKIYTSSHSIKRLKSPSMLGIKPGPPGWKLGILSTTPWRRARVQYFNTVKLKQASNNNLHPIFFLTQFVRNFNTCFGKIWLVHLVNYTVLKTDAWMNEYWTANNVHMRPKSLYGLRTTVGTWNTVGKTLLLLLCFTTLLTSQVISIAFYIEREKYDKFCSEALISAWDSFTCHKSTIRDQRLNFPSVRQILLGGSNFGLRFFYVP